MTDFKILYIPCGNINEAKAIARKLVEEKLIACANIHPKIFSIYKWEEQIEESEEALLFAKTHSSLTTQTEKRIKELHSYDCPCILELNIENTNSEYLGWLHSQLEISLT